MLGNVIKQLFVKQTPNQPAIVQDIIELDDANRLVRARHGWFLANRFDVYLGTALVRYGECIELEHRFLASLLQPGDNVIEVGANIGTHTVGLAKRVGPFGKVIAIEPQPHVFRILNANLALNALLNVETHAIGCGREVGEMIVPTPDYGAAKPHNSGGVSLTDSGPGVAVRILPLDELVSPELKIRLMKVDVEGMELEVLQGAIHLIDEQRPILYVENDRLAKRQALIAWLLDRGYRLWWHLPPLFNPDNFFGEMENIYRNIASINMICLPREAAIPDLGRLQEIISPDQDMSMIGGM